MATKAQKQSKATAEKLAGALTVNDIFNENTEVACVALMRETSKVLKEFGFRQVDVEISDGERNTVVSLKANPKVFTSDIVHIDKTHPAYIKAKKKMEARAKLLQPFTDAFKDINKAPLKITIGTKEKRTYQLISQYNSKQYELAEINGQPPPKPRYTYRDSVFRDIMFGNQPPYYKKYAAVKHPDDATKGGWIIKKPRYCMGYIGWQRLFTDTKDHIAIIMAAGTKLLTTLRPEEYKNLNDIRDQYIASCMLGVTDITFSEEREDE